jgi:hypothetical protein
MRLPGFCSGTYQSQSPNIDAEDCINLYPEKSGSEGAKVPIALLHCPGKTVFAKIPEATGGFVYTVNGRSFAAATDLYELLANGTTVVRGSMGAAPAGPTQMASNQDQLIAMNNGNLFVLTLATNVFVAVDMSQFNGPVSQIGFADGYFIATLQNSHTFQQSNLEDGTTWNGLNIATVSLFPDNFTSMICDHREPTFFSGKKSVTYYNSGAGFPVFIPIQDAFLEEGAGATFATVQLDNSIFWLSQDERGWMVAKRLNGAVGERISTHAIELAWQTYANPSAAVGYTYQEEGHSVWVIRFPGETYSWVYDVASGLWHKRAYYNPTTGRYESDHSQSHTFNFGLHVVADWASGNIYQQSNEIYTDNQQAIRWARRSTTMSRDNKWIYYSEFELDVEVGLAPVPPLLDGDGGPRAAQVTLRWSNDGAKTWSSDYLLNCGQAGEFNARARKTQLGRARRRVWEVSGTDPIPWRIADAYVIATPSTAVQAA